MSEIKQLKISDPEYPPILKEINDPPKKLYYRGSLNAFNYSVAVAVVGTRRCSEYGREAAEALSAGLAKTGVTIVSGLARGIDAYAHKTALKYGAPAIAILGTGVDDKSISPKTNRNLAHQIIESGGIIASEYEPGAKVWPSHFPKRNRIIAGLSQSTLVVEAPFKSGSMITARLALDYNRDVYAVPGSIYSRISEGCNDLIKKGAKCVTQAEDILEELKLNHKLSFDNHSDNTIQLEGVAKNIYELIAESPEAVHIDFIIEKIKLKTDEASQAITELMLEDRIKETEPGYYIASQ